jgi:hypothetical protein
MASIAPNDALIPPHRANPRGRDFRERQVIISVVERKLRDRSQNQAERETFERVAKPVTPERMRP